MAFFNRGGEITVLPPDKTPDRVQINAKNSHSVADRPSEMSMMVY